MLYVLKNLIHLVLDSNVNNEIKTEYQYHIDDNI